MAKQLPVIGMPDCKADPHDVQQNGERKAWDAVWVTGEELCHEGILLSPRMMEDHYALSLQASIHDAS